MPFLQQGKGGILWHQPVSLPPAWWDADPAPTVSLLLPDGVSVMVAEKSATIGPSTTVGEGGTAAGASVVPADDTTDMVTGNREQYLIGPSASDRQWEWVELVGVAVDSVRVRRPLVHSYAEGDLLRSGRLSVVVDGADVPTCYHNAFSCWKFSVDGVEVEERVPFTISPWNPRIPATTNDLIRIYARAPNQVADPQDLDDLLAEKWEEILGDLALKIDDPGRIASGMPLRNLLLYRTIRDLAAFNGEQTIFELYHQLYDETMTAALRQTPVDADGDGTIAQDERFAPAMCGRMHRG